MTRYPVLLAVGLVVAACDVITGGSEPGFLLATVQGAVDVEYEGTGTFSTGTRPTGQRTFGISSQGEGGSAGQSFFVRQWDGGRLRTGTYALIRVTGGLDDPSVTGVNATFARVEGADYEVYDSASGQLVVTRSSSRAVEGHFEFSGERRIPADGATITVHGSFRATPVSITVSVP